MERPANATYVRSFLPKDSLQTFTFGPNDARDFDVQLFDYIAAYNVGGTNNSVNKRAIAIQFKSNNILVKECILDDFTDVNTARGAASKYRADGTIDYTARTSCSLSKTNGGALGSQIAFASGDAFTITTGNLGFYRTTISTVNSVTSGTSGSGTAKPYVAANQSIFGGDIQKDGKYSVLYIAYDATNTPIAYTFSKNRTMPNSQFDFINVLVADWQTNLTSTNIISLNKPSNAYWCPDVRGYQGGINTAILSQCTVIADIFTIKFVPGLEKYRVFAGMFAPEANPNLGSQRRNLQNIKNDFTTLPATISFDYNTDFMPFITSNAPANITTARPTLSWNYSGTTSALQRVFMSIYERNKASGNSSVQLPGFDYFWSLDYLPTNTTSVSAPVLPTAIADYAPIEGTQKFRYFVQLTEKAINGSFRISELERNFNDDTDARVASTGVALQNSTSKEPALADDAYQINLR